MSPSFPARCGLAVVSGAVYALAYPLFGPAAFAGAHLEALLIVPGIAGLLVALRDQCGTRARTIGFLHGMSACAVSLSWLYQVFGGMAVALWCVLAAFIALFAEMQGRAGSRGMAGWKLAAFTAVNWCGWEFIRAELFPLKFPWLTAGLALGPNKLLPWIGVYGVGAIAVFAVALMVIGMRKAALAPIVVLLAAMSLAFKHSTPKAADPLAVKVAGLQLENVSLDPFLAGTKQLPPDIDYVVWPEYAVPYDIRANKRDWNLVRELCRERGITLTFGTQSRPGDGDEWRNIALTLDPNGVLGEHNKVHTVHFFDDGLPGKSALPVETAHGKIGTPVCFDCDYEGVTRRMTAAGAEMFIVPIMDAATWTARQHDQHAELFRIRACENGRWMFVCATSGVSQVIDPNGQIHARLPALAKGPLIGTMKREKKLTIYTRVGWLTPWVILGAAILCWLALLLPRRLPPATP